MTFAKKIFTVVAFALVCFWFLKLAQTDSAPKAHEGREKELFKEEHVVQQSDDYKAGELKVSPATDNQHGGSPVKLESFSDWLIAYRADPTREMLEEGRHFAIKRRDRMLEWMKHDPDRVIDEMLPFSDYHTMPNEIASLIEAPFVDRIDIKAITTCIAPNEHAEDGQLKKTGHCQTLYSYRNNKGKVIEIGLPQGRKGMTTKYSVPVLGLKIENRAVLHRHPVLALTDEEKSAALELLKIDSSDDANALMGHKLISIKESSIEALNQKIALAESAPSPYAVEELFSNFQEDENSYSNMVQTEEADTNYEDAAWTKGPKKILFIRAVFPNLDQVSSYEQVQYNLSEANKSIEAMSYGQTTFSTITVTNETFVLPDELRDLKYLPEFGGEAAANLSTLHKEARDLASSAGYDLSQYDFIGVVEPGVIGLSRGQLGGPYLWIAGNPYFGTYIHELGHCLGLVHASGWNANDGTIVPAPSEDTSDYAVEHVEYGDPFDIMGTGPPNGDFHVLAKRRLSWLNDDQIVTLNSLTDQIIRIYPFDDQVSGGHPTLGVKTQIENSHTYWTSFRRRAKTTNGDFSEGAYIIWQDNSVGARLIDTTPQSIRWDNVDALLSVGSTFKDPTGLITITTIGRGGEGTDEWLDVRFIIGAEGNNAPTALIEAPEHAGARKTIRFSGSGIDPDGDALTYFWDFGDGTTLSGEEAEHKYPVGGNYTVSLTTRDGLGGVDTKTAVVNVTDPIAPWTTYSTLNNSSARELIYHNGLFFMATPSDLFLSLDGITWSSDGITGLPDYFPTSTRINGNTEELFLITGSPSAGESAIYSSENSMDWSAEQIPAGLPELTSVSANGTSCLAVGYSGTVIRRSVNGIWNNLDNSITTENLHDVLYAGDFYWIVGENNTILRSADGLVWQDVSNRSPFYSYEDLYDIHSFGNHIFIRSRQSAAVSKDSGESWFYLEFDSGLISNEVRSIAVNDGIAIISEEGINKETWSWSNVYHIYDLETGQLGLAHADVFGKNAAIGSGRILLGGSNPDLHASGIFPGSTPPTVTLSASSSSDGDMSITYTCNASDPDGDKLYYFWDTGDGILRPGTATFTQDASSDINTDIRVIVSDGKGNLIAATLDTKLEAWYKNHINDPLDHELDADPDLDNRINLIEYALGLDPASADRMEVIWNLNDRRVSGFKMRMDDPNLTVQISTSADLAQWMDTGFTYDITNMNWVSNNPEVITVRSATEVESGVWSFVFGIPEGKETYFIRVKAEYQPKE